VILKVCPLCGANLDPGETCDCESAEKGRPAATGTAHPRKELPSAVYQAMGKKSICGGYSNFHLKGALT